MSRPKSAYFRTCEKPTLSPVQGKVTGTIPEWLKGTLIRNGPGIKQIGTDEFVHVFDGLAVLHSFNIEDGKVTYFNRPLEGETYKRSIDAQRIITNDFGSGEFRDPCNAFFLDLKTDFVTGDDNKPNFICDDNCSVNVCYHGDQLYALTETNITVRIDPKTLKTIGKAVRYSEHVAINRATAHPHVLDNGDVLNLGNSYKPGIGVSYAFIRIPPKFDSNEMCFDDAKVVAEIPTRHENTMAYFHSFGLAGDYIIFVEAPIWLNMANMYNEGKPLSKLFEWKGEEKTRFYVVSLTTGKIHPIVYETEDLFTLHHVNAYEEDGQIVVDLSAYKEGKFITENLDQATVDKVYNSGGSGQRYVLPLNVDTTSDRNLVTLKNTTATAHVVSTGESVVVNVKPHTFYPSFIEFPRINYNFNGKKYRYFYGNGTNTKAEDITAFPDPNVLVKVDLETDMAWTWTEPNVVTPEPVFVPNPTGTEEEDGVVLIPLLHLDDLKKTSLLILDAKTFKEIGRAEFDAEGTITSTFHGEWASAGDRIHRY